MYAEVEVKEIDLGKRVLMIRTLVRNQEWVRVLGGTAAEKFPRASREARDVQ